TPNQVLTKLSDEDGDVGWTDKGGASKAYMDAVMSIPGLAVYLPFQEDLFDIVSQDDAISIGGASVVSDGVIPEALGGHGVSFNGLNQGVQIPLDLQSPAITIFMWAFIPSQPNSDNILAELGTGASENNSFMLDMTGAGGV